MIIKVCGMRDADNIRQIDELGCVDWMGFIFFPPSSRNVERVPDYLPQHCKRVGVFVNATLEEIRQRQKEFGFHLIQLHGDETPDYCEQLRTCLPPKTQFIKMVQIATADDLERVKSYDGMVDYLLFETKCKGYGGSGKQFDWDILQGYKGHIPFLLTGGIKPTDAEKVLSFHHPQFVGIDLNSKFETAPAFKDANQISNFVRIIKSSNPSINCK